MMIDLFWLHRVVIFLLLLQVNISLSTFLQELVLKEFLLDIVIK